MATADGLLLADIAFAAPLPDGAAQLIIGTDALRPPSASLLVGTAATPRLVHAARSPGPIGAGTATALRLGRIDAAAFAWPRPCAPEDFAAGFPPHTHATLLRFLVGTCARMLRGANDPGLAGLCMALAAPGGEARRIASPAGGLSAWQVPVAPDGAWTLITGSAIRRLDAPRGGVLLIDGAVPASAVLLPPAPLPPLRLVTGAGQASLSRRVRQAWAGRGAAPSPIPALAARAAHDVQAGAVLREAQLLAPTRPTRLDDPARPVGAGLDLALSDHAGGVFACGWLRDPLGLVASVVLLGPGLVREIPRAALHRVARADLDGRFARAPLGGAGPQPGFVAYLPGSDPARTAQWRLAVRLTGGEAIEVAAPPGLMPPAIARDLVLRAAHPSAVTPALLDDCIAPAAARLHQAALREASGTPEVIGFGTALRRPTTTLVIPLYRNLRFLRFQLAAFARDAELRRAELVYVLDSPEQRTEVDHLLRGMAAMLDLPLRLVVMPRNAGYAAACNAGAAVAHAATLLFLNSDVLPDAPGWLGRMRARLARDRRIAAVGPKLIFDGGTIQHAGLLFRRGEDGLWLNDHYCKGFPRLHPDALRARRVPGVTGAALLVRRAAFEAARGFCTDYIVGDFEDSDLCLKLRAAGHEIAYEPAAELFHFERQSIALHDGHARTLAGVLNRRLHHARWDGTISALMPRFPDA
jgi:GT2 family glycosyltransferase